MPDFSEQWNQDRANNRQKIRLKKKPANPAVEITTAEWLIVGAMAVIADILTTIGLPCGLILLLWYVMKFHQFPTGKIGVSGFFEVMSLGWLPGWTGFFIATLCEQKGYTLKWLGKLARAKI